MFFYFLPAFHANIPESIAAALVVSMLLFFAGLIGLFTKLLRHLGTFADALQSHARLNRDLNEELAKAVAQRQTLQRRYDELDMAHRQQKADNSRLALRLDQLDQDNKALAARLEAMNTALDQRDESHLAVVSALTAQLSTVKEDLATEREKRRKLEAALDTERKERQRIEHEMRAEVDRLSEANIQLVAENQALRKEVDSIREKRSELSEGAGTEPAERAKGTEHV